MRKLAWLSLALMLCACAGSVSSTISERHDTAEKIAASGGMTERVIQAGIFNLTSWERIGLQGATADLYIEGDGLAWIDRHTKSLNPTPPDPLALHLATQDKAQNVIYMARPCQYTGWNGKGPCPDLYWTSGTAAAEVIAAYQQALNDIKARNHITGFNLVGYSGGGAIAVLVAAERLDVLSIRTVAGNIDYAVFSVLHGVSPISSSIDPVSVAAKIAHIPQLHFIGGKDDVVPRAIFDAWKDASGTNACAYSSVIAANDHERGWADSWPALLNVPVSCVAAR